MLTTAGVIVLAALLRGSTDEAMGDAIAFDHARALWSVALVILGGLALWRGASIPHGWFTGEGEWLGTVPLSRVSIAASALGGTLAGLVALTVVATLTITCVTRLPDDPMELAAVGGPEHSILLLEGESFEQLYSERGLDLPDGTRTRVRVTPTVGGEGPTTFVRASAGGPAIEQPVARRRWIEVPHRVGTIALDNLGPGALAVLGPWPVEIWRPTRALLGGHARAGVHACALLCVLASVAYAAGAWMGPGIAALLAFSLWIASGLPRGSPEWTRLGLSGPSNLDGVLGAIGEGRAPSPLSTVDSVVSLAAIALAILAVRPALDTWYRENRS